MTQSEDRSTPIKCSPEAFEFKRIMQTSLERFLEENEDWNKTRVAAEMESTPADLSHWLSPLCPFTIPGHKVPRYCRIVRDNALIWHIESKYAEAV